MSNWLLSNARPKTETDSGRFGAGWTNRDEMGNERTGEEKVDGVRPTRGRKMKQTKRKKWTTGARRRGKMDRLEASE